MSFISSCFAGIRVEAWNLYRKGLDKKSFKNKRKFLDRMVQTSQKMFHHFSFKEVTRIKSIYEYRVFHKVRRI